MADPPTRDDGSYVERLWAPWWWWAISAALVASLAVAVGYPLGPVAGIIAAAVAGGGVAWLLVSSAAMVQVGGGVLVAGRARLPLWAAGGVRPLDAAEAAALRGRDADPRAFLLLRPWVPRAVRVDVDDPADPTPYWYVSTREPGRLAVAVARGAAAIRPASPDEDSNRQDGAG